MIVVTTEIGYGSPHKAGTADVHGSPLGREETLLTKQALGWPVEPAFLIPEEALAPFRAAAERGAALQAEWEELRGRWAEAHPELAADLAARRAGELPAGWESALPHFAPEDGPLATRSASGKTLNALAQRLPELLGGSADLAPSNNTEIKGEVAFSATATGRNFHFGVREHAMGAVLSGMALSGLLIPYGGTFLIFSDYMRPAIRLAALMGLRVIYVFTHDSVFLGEDGPTHQPIAHLAALRAIPNLTVIRPADANETVVAWQLAVENRKGPTALALTRQKLPVPDETTEWAREGVPRGAYVLADPDGGAAPEAILIATGSEVALALDAHRELTQHGIPTRVVSMPSWEIFARQSRRYRDSVLPPECRKRLAIEAGSPLGWHRWVGVGGRRPRPRPLRRLGPLQGPGDRLRLHRRRGGAAGQVAARPGRLGRRGATGTFPAPVA